MIDAAALLTAPEGVRLVGEGYNLLLLSLVPLIGAFPLAWAFRHRSAGERVLIWRSTVIVLLVIFVGQLLPFQWKAWIVPQELAMPLIALGRMQLASLEQLAPLSGETTLVQWLVAIYIVGVLAVALPTFAARLKLQRIAREASTRGYPALAPLIAEAKRAAGVSRRVQVLVSLRSAVPMTWGVFRPVVIVPAAALRWPDEHLRAVLLHELNHVRRADALFATVARAICALHWFNPAIWWVAKRLSTETELACDDRVLAAGIRRSDYAELLAIAGAGQPLRSAAGSLALGREAGLRQRLRDIVDTRRVVRLPTRAATVAAASVTLVVSGAMSLVQIIPTRDVLTTLMRDDRWESRAYAVVRLAERADSVEVARAAAQTDPSPRVRAWAQYALAQLPPSADLFTSPEKP